MISGKIRLIAMLLAGSALLSAFTPDKKKLVKTPEGFVFVPMGTTTIGSDTFSVQAFWMAKTEITNKDYREFLFDLKASGNLDAYQKALPDTTQWRDKYAYNEPYVELYFRHPAYSEYPVVGISHEQAERYCVWLTKKMKEAYGDYIYDVRLPTREEWVMAARGTNPSAIYSWNNSVKKKKIKGNGYGIPGNYLNIGPESIHFNDSIQEYVVLPYAGSMGMAGIINDAADIIAPAESYWPNNYGLFNMSGNVAEMVQQSGIVVGGSWKSTGYDVRIESTTPYTGPRNDVGFRPVITYPGKPKN